MRRSLCRTSAFLLVAGPALAGPQALRAGSDERTTIAVYQATAPSVVRVVAVPRPTGRVRPAKATPRAGSGFVWDKQGHIITAAALLAGAESARVTLNDGTAWQARLIGVDAKTGLAVLSVDVPKKRLRPITIGASKDLRVGQSAFALGTPRKSVNLAARVLSGLDGEYHRDGDKAVTGLLAVDGVLGAAWGGGPVVDSAGRLIGVTLSPPGGGGHREASFCALAVDKAAKVIPQLIRSGKVQEP